MVQITCKIDGMMCDMCEAHMNDVIRNNFKVKKVSSDHRKGQSVIVAEEPLDEDALKKAISEIGYELISVKKEPYEKKGLFGFLKK